MEEFFELTVGKDSDGKVQTFYLSFFTECGFGG